jgi:hypothetical protein
VDDAWVGDYYTAFVIELHSRRVHVLGSTPYPDEAFIRQTLRQVTGAGTGIVRDGGILICDRDPKWNRGVELLLTTEGVRVVRTPACLHEHSALSRASSRRCGPGLFMGSL